MANTAATVKCKFCEKQTKLDRALSVSGQKLGVFLNILCDHCGENLSVQIRDSFGRPCVPRLV